MDKSTLALGVLAFIYCVFLIKKGYFGDSTKWK